MMRARRLLGGSLTVFGFVLATGALIATISHYVLPLSNVVMAAVGILLLAVGLILLITETLELWLSRGQAALVDGLQAG